FAALLHPSLFPAQFLFALAQGVCLLCRLAAAIDFSLDEPWIFQQPDDLAPHELIQIILSDWSICTNWPVQPSISIRTDAAIVVQFLLRRVRGCAVQAVAALFAYQHALQQGRFNGAPRRMTFVLFQLLLRQR